MGPPKNLSSNSQELFYYNTAVVFFYSFTYYLLNQIHISLLKLEPRLNPSPCDSVIARLLYPAAVDSKLKPTLCFPTAASQVPRTSLDQEGTLSRNPRSTVSTSPALAEKHLPHCWQRSTVAKNKKPGLRIPARYRNPTTTSSSSPPSPLPSLMATPGTPQL